MTTEPAQVRIMREALEGVLSPKLAQAVLFEALGDSGQLPSSSEELLTLVRGPVQDAVQRRSGGDAATAVVTRLEGILGRRPSERPPAPDGEATVAVPTDEHPVAVLVVSAGPWFGGRLAAALGPDRVGPVFASDEVGVQAALAEHGPAIVIVDATDFPAMDPESAAATLRGLPSTATAAVWGGELPYGRRVAFALQESGVDAMTFPRKNGIDPLLDLIRARRAQ